MPTVFLRDVISLENMLQAIHLQSSNTDTHTTHQTPDPDPDPDTDTDTNTDTDKDKDKDTDTDTMHSRAQAGTGTSDRDERKVVLEFFEWGTKQAKDTTISQQKIKNPYQVFSTRGEATTVVPVRQNTHA